MSNNTLTKTFKKYKNRERSNRTFNGIGVKDVFNLELTIYQRLKNCRNFPKLISADPINFTLTLEYCGESLKKIKKSNTEKLYLASNINDQISSIVNDLEKNNIQYVDVSLHNLCYKNGLIFLIDFDSAIIDDNPLSNERKYYLDKFYNTGGYTNLKTRLLNIIAKHFTLDYFLV